MNSLYVVVLLYSLLLVLLSSFDVSMAGRAIPSSAPSTVVRPLVTDDVQDYVSMRPHLNPGRKQVFRGREFKGCLPKGFRHASAPSRFVNYHTLGAAPGCNSSKQSKSKKPWHVLGILTTCQLVDVSRFWQCQCFFCTWIIFDRHGYMMNYGDMNMVSMKVRKLWVDHQCMIILYVPLLLFFQVLLKITWKRFRTPSYV